MIEEHYYNLRRPNRLIARLTPCLYEVNLEVEGDDSRNLKDAIG